MPINITDTVEKYFDQTVKQLIENYDKLGLRASGRYAKELKSIVTQQGTRITAQIIGPAESYYMEQGRGPNKDRSHQAVKNLGMILEQWVVDKGIDVNPYAAAHKIVNEGIKVPNPFNPGGVISDVIDDQWFDDLYDLLKFDIVEDIRSDVLTQFKA